MAEIEVIYIQNGNKNQPNNNQDYFDKGIRMEKNSYSKFNIDQRYIESKLFNPETPKQGQVITNLNIAVLPDYLQYIKSKFNKKEQMLLSQYQLQTFLIEIAIKPLPEKKSLELCTEKIIKHIKQNQSFWMKESRDDDGKLKIAKEEYQKDLGQIKYSLQGLKETYQEKPYRLMRRKIIPDDYKLMQGQFQLSLIKHPLNVTLIPYIINFTFKQGSPGMSRFREQDRRSLYRQIIEQLILGIMSKSKNTLQFERGTLLSEQQIESKQEGENLMNEFREFVEEMPEMQTKSTNIAREYLLIINLLQILMRLEMKLHIPENKQEQDKLSEMEIEKPQKQHKMSRNELENIEEGQIKLLKSDICNKIYTLKEYSIICNHLISTNHSQLLKIAQAKRQKELRSITQWQGFLDPVDHIEHIQLQFQQMFDHPQITLQSKYKVHGIEIPWREQQYKNFLTKFLQFYNVPTNNRKIALGMAQMIQEEAKNNGLEAVSSNNDESVKAPESIEPSHVKYIKGIYCRNMGQRIDQGEIGGGKKGILESKIQFLKRDIESFNMRWFKKEGVKAKGRGKQKGKKNSKKRRRRFEVDDQDEYDSDY